MTYLTTHLPFGDISPAPDSQASSSSTASSLPPAGSHLLITDTLNSPGHFTLYHLVSAALQQKRKIVWVDFRGEGRASWETILKKLGTPLPPTSSPAFVHISPTSLPYPSDTPRSQPGLFDAETGFPDLRPTYDVIIDTLSKEAGGVGGGHDEQGDGPLIILDGLAELCFIGFSGIQVSQFVRAVLALCRLKKASLVSTLHADHLPLTSTASSAVSDSTNQSPVADLLLRLIRMGGGGWWRVANLASGRSGDVHGEISAHPLSPPKPGSFADVPRDRPLQYRLEASTVKVFPKGTGRGFL